MYMAPHYSLVSPNSQLPVLMEALCPQGIAGIYKVKEWFSALLPRCAWKGHVLLGKGETFSSLLNGGLLFHSYEMDLLKFLLLVLLAT